jgi:hypothetical protein
VPIEFDPENPPKEPPRGADPLLWRLSYQVRTDNKRIERALRAGRGRGAPGGDAYAPDPAPYPYKL